MAGANPQRTSWTSSEVVGELKPEWYVHFDAYISQKVQIIAAANTLFIAAADGLHALDSNSGGEKWFFATELPPGNAPTYADGVVYLGGLDHRLYAINATTGRQIWSFEAGAGFHTNPLVMNQTVYAGNRDGYFYAVHATGNQAGTLAWRYQTGGPILYSAAEKDGVLFFASSDMFAYALNATNGSLVWKSARLPGDGFHSWWPVIYRDYVVFSGDGPYRTVGPFADTKLDNAAYPANVSEGQTIGAYGTVAGDWASGTRTMNASRISQYFETYPHRRTTVFLYRSDGREYTYDSDGDGKPEYAPFLYVGAESGNRYPPVVGADDVIYQTNNYIYSAISRGHVTGWKIGTTTISIPTTDVSAVDEPMGYAVGGNTVYWKICCDRKAGSFSLVSDAKRTYFDQGGQRLRMTLPDLFDEYGWDYSYWKHGDPTPPIPYNGRIYTINNNALVAFSPYGKDPVLPANEYQGVETGVAPTSIELSIAKTGLNTKVTLDGFHWPRLYQQERYYELREASTTRANHFQIFEVAGSTAVNPSSVQVIDSNVSSVLISRYSSNQTLETVVSKRTPVVLFKNTSAQYMLRGTVTAFAYPTSAGIQVVQGSTTLSAPPLSEGWLLVWDSSQNHRWVPLVLSLQNSPTQIRLDSSGLLLTFSSTTGAGQLGLTPLYGMSAPRTNEPTTWQSGIPVETADRVRMIDRIARAVPAASTDSFRIDPATGDGVFQYSYTYDGNIVSNAWGTPPLRLAYIPPHIALAGWNESPIRFNGLPWEQTTDLFFLTPLGRVAGIESDGDVANLEIRLPGIANYWRQPSAPSSPPSPGDPLQAVLVSEIQKILAAGHLRPGFGSTGLWDTRAANGIGHYLVDYWHNPAETVYTLSRALPLLPSDLQVQVRQYLQNEYALYPTTSFSHVGWAAGTSREAFALPPEVDAERVNFTACGDCNSWGFPSENPYASWMYAANFGNALQIYNESTARMDPWRQFKQSMPYMLNSQIAGYIGYFKLGSLANVGSQDASEQTLANLLVLRAALSKYPSALQETGFEYGGYKWSVRTYAPNMSDTLFSLRTMGTTWSQTPLYGYPIDLIYGLSGPSTGGAYVFGIDYVNLVPEQARFMRDYTYRQELDAISEYERRTPYWFVSEAEEAAGEGTIHPLYDTIALYQAKAMILGAGRAELEKYVDAPAVPIGDLYFIQRLVLALEAK